MATNEIEGIEGFDMLAMFRKAQMETVLDAVAFLVSIAESLDETNRDKAINLSMRLANMTKTL